MRFVHQATRAGAVDIYLVPSSGKLLTSSPIATGVVFTGNTGYINVPAGTYTIYTVPGATQWQLIINKQNGQWGTEYHQDQDLGRTPMMSKPMSSPQEVMSISFENTHGKSTELHIRWEKSDEYVPVTAE